MSTGKKILIVEDEESIRSNIHEILQYKKFDAIQAINGVEGVQKALQYNPDLILCDINMPEMDGYEMYRTLQQIPATAMIPFIFLTARNQIDDLRTAMQMGADDYITKPFRINDLLHSIEKRLEKFDKVKNIGEKKFDAISENPFVGVYIYLDNRFIYTNQRFNEIAGYSNEELFDREMEYIVCDEDKDMLRNRLDKCLKGIDETLWSEFFLCNHKRKQRKAVQLFGKYVLLRGRPAVIGNLLELNANDTKSNAQHELYSQNELLSKIMDLLTENNESLTADEMIQLSQQINDLQKHQIKKEPPVQLTRRETEVLQLICEGYTNSEIAEKLFISNRTVDNHRMNILAKTDSKNTASLVAYAISNKLVEI